MNPRRLWLLVRQALREAVHLRLAWSVGTAAVGLVAGASLLREFNFGLEEARFFEDTATGIVLLFGSIQAVLLTVTLVHGGLERGAPGLLFTRGVRRSEWLVASLLAVWVSLGWLVLAAQLVLALVLAWHGHQALPLNLAATGGREVLQLGLVATFALATSAVSRSPLLATTMALALTLAAQLAPVVSWAGAHGRPAVRLGWQILGCLLPNFEVFAEGVAPGRAVAWAAGYAALYTLTACLVFAHREF